MQKQEPQKLIRLENIQKRDLDNINFFAFSPKIPAATIRQYKRIVRDYIKLRRKHDHPSCDYNKIYNDFVVYLCDKECEFYFMKLRPFITVTLQNQFALDAKFFGQHIVKHLQPLLLENLQKLTLDQQHFLSLQWISFLNMPKIQFMSLKFSFITILKPVAKCLWSNLQLFVLSYNKFTNLQTNELYKARYLKKELIGTQGMQIQVFGSFQKQKFLEGVKFNQKCSFGFGFFTLSSFGKQFASKALKQKLSADKGVLQN